MTNQPTRDALLAIIDRGRAHMSFDEMLSGFPAEHYNTRPPNVPYSFWGLLEHVRICCELTLSYAVGESFTPLRWPDDFWPATDQTATDAEWSATTDAIRAAIAEFRRIAADPEIDLAARCRNAGKDSDDTILFEFIDAIDHNAYHFGEFAILRQVLGLWPSDRA